MPSTAPVRVFTAFTDRPPETLSSSVSEISTVSTWGVEFMMELPFVWICHKGERPSGDRVKAAAAGPEPPSPDVRN
ncbi:hypothetical protein GCM10027073_14640 [Streptomyces chlorus]